MRRRRVRRRLATVFSAHRPHVQHVDWWPPLAARSLAAGVLGGGLIAVKRSRAPNVRAPCISLRRSVRTGLWVVHPLGVGDWYSSTAPRAMPILCRVRLLRRRPAERLPLTFYSPCVSVFQPRRRCVRRSGTHTTARRCAPLRASNAPAEELACMFTLAAIVEGGSEDDTLVDCTRLIARRHGRLDLLC